MKLAFPRPASSGFVGFRGSAGGTWGRALRGALVLAAALVVVAVGTAHAAPVVVVDRVVARFADPENDSAGSLRFAMMRELVVEAWLLAFERSSGTAPTLFDETHVKAALERHVTEDLLGSRSLPPAIEKKLPQAVAEARTIESMAVGGDARLALALAKAGGIAELDAILLRRARAELFLEGAVAQAIQVSDAELRALHAKPGAVPEVLASKPFDEAVVRLRGWVRAQRLREAGQAYFQAVRTRLRLEVVSG